MQIESANTLLPARAFIRPVVPVQGKQGFRFDLKEQSRNGLQQERHQRNTMRFIGARHSVNEKEALYSSRGRIDQSYMKTGNIIDIYI